MPDAFRCGCGRYVAQTGHYTIRAKVAGVVGWDEGGEEIHGDRTQNEVYTVHECPVCKRVSVTDTVFLVAGDAPEVLEYETFVRTGEPKEVDPDA